MIAQLKSVTELLDLASRLRMFASEARDRGYFDKFQRGAEGLELEAVGHAVSGVIAAALRRERHDTLRKGNSVG